MFSAPSTITDFSFLQIFLAPITKKCFCKMLLHLRIVLLCSDAYDFPLVLVLLGLVDHEPGDVGPRDEVGGHVVVEVNILLYHEVQV